MKHSTSKLLAAAVLAAALFRGPVAKADITATVYPGYQFSPGEIPTVTTLNLLATPTIVISGTLGGTNVALAAGSVTGTMLSGTVVDGVTLDFNGSTPRAIEIMAGGVHTNNLDASAFALPIAGGGGKLVQLLYDNSTLQTNASGQLYVNGANLGNGVALSPTNVNGRANSIVGAWTNGVNTNLMLGAGITITNNALGLIQFTSTNANLPGQNGFTLAIPHGFGAVPRSVRWVLVCATAEGGFAQNAEVDALSAYDTGNNSPHFTSGADATNVFLVARTSGNIGIYNYSTQSGFTITTANWRLKAYVSP